MNFCDYEQYWGAESLNELDLTPVKTFKKVCTWVHHLGG